MSSTEITVNINGKLNTTYWFRDPNDVDLFVGLIDQLYEVEFQANQQLTNAEIKSVIEAL